MSSNQWRIPCGNPTCPVCQNQLSLPRSQFMQPFSGKEVPLVPGTLRLYRRWLLRDQGLRALNFDYYWKDGWNEAECRAMDRVPTAYRTGIHRQPTPHPDCTCGFYARYHHTVPDGITSGVIEVSGRVILGTKGVRAERARIMANEWTNDYIMAMYPSVKWFRNKEDMWAEYPPPDVSELIGPQEPKPEPKVRIMTEQEVTLFREFLKGQWKQ